MRKSVLAAIAFSIVASVPVKMTLASAPEGPFLVFDGLLYRGKPDLGRQGMIPIGGVNPPPNGYQSADGVNDADTLANVRGMQGARGVVYLDYEQWGVYQVPAPQLAESIRKLSRVADIAHTAIPTAKFGYYGLLPCLDYWSLVKNDPDKIKRWEECNTQLDPLAEHVDVIFPSLYTFYNDPQGWDIFAAAQLRAARRYHKPVYAFLWPEFHVSNRLLKDKNLPGNFWRHELEFCRTRADGVVIWGGYQKPWDENAEWWIETKAFLAGLKPR